MVTFNAQKTETMTISRKIDKPDHPPLYMDSNDISTVSEHKHLGLVISDFWFLSSPSVDNLNNSSICFGKIVVFFETPIFDSVSAHKTCASSTTNLYSNST
jgi:hypothetical protein